MAEPRHCRVCRRPLPGDRVGGDCEECKALYRALGRLHRRSRAHKCEADQAAKAALVEAYAALAGAGRRLFE